MGPLPQAKPAAKPAAGTVKLQAKPAAPKPKPAAKPAASTVKLQAKPAAGTVKKAAGTQAVGTGPSKKVGRTVGGRGQSGWG